MPAVSDRCGSGSVGYSGLPGSSALVRWLRVSLVFIV